MLLKTHDGVELSGGTTSRSRDLQLDRVEPGIYATGIVSVLSGMPRTRPHKGNI